MFPINLQKTASALVASIAPKNCICTCSHVRRKTWLNARKPQKLTAIEAVFGSTTPQTRFYSQLDSVNTDSLVKQHHQSPDVDSVRSFADFDGEIGNQFSRKNFSPSMPSHSDSLSHYVNSSKTLQTLVMFGVSLYDIQRKHPEALDFLVKLKYPDDFQSVLHWLKSHGIEPAEMGDIITKNPFILDPACSVKDFSEITEYLSSKKFTAEQISSLLVRHPQILNIDVLKLDGILGFYSKIPTNYERRKITYSAEELRNIVVRCPQLLNRSLRSVYLTIQILERSCSFTIAEIRLLLLQRPQILLMDSVKLDKLYRFYVNEMGLTNQHICRSPFILDTRIKIVRPRHLYLKHLGKDIYGEEEQGYIGLYDIVPCTDEEFCRRCQLDYNHFVDFMKTL